MRLKIASVEKGISTILAAFLLVVIVIVASLIVYIWSTDLLGSLMPSAPVQGEVLELMEYEWRTNNLKLQVWNVGTIDSVIRGAFIGEVDLRLSGEVTIPSNKVGLIDIDTSRRVTTVGAAYDLRLVSKTGSVFAFALTYGMQEKLIGESCLEINVRPPGYPEIGATWTIKAYIVSKTVHGPIRTPAKNAEAHMIVYLKDGSSRIDLEYTNDKGEALFCRDPDFVTVSFQAFLSLETSVLVTEKVQLTEEFVPAEKARWASDISLFMSLPYVLVGLYVSRERKPSTRRWKAAVWLFFAVVAVVLVISGVLTVSSIAWMFYAGTAWGYPKNILGDMMAYDTFVSLFSTWVVLYICALFMGLLFLVEPKIKGYPTKPLRKLSEPSTLTEKSSR